ncbi:hypothetical protein GSH19_00135 [Lactobacillus sp. S2-2]|uniref:hypothetical protein n=1 Tax=Lactobacillus sp. S2-2 TaxID=2692917 RepID=UPI001F4298AD|nr:hypothetical protein [Lactobacillus sp. S2-2]MCF6514594.1 hypothetical protein [Lactobacillus sp. S2-2]
MEFKEMNGKYTSLSLNQVASIKKFNYEGKDCYSVSFLNRNIIISKGEGLRLKKYLLKTNIKNLI